MRNRWWLLALPALALFGCGGGSEDSNTSSGGDGNVSLFATDNMDGNDHVWVRVHRVELQMGSKSLVVFDDADGKVLDLRSLRDNSGAKFAYLGTDNVPRGSYTSASVTLGKSLHVVSAGAKTAQQKTFADSMDSSNGKTKVNVPLGAGVVVGVGNSNVVLDFDLASWTDNGGQVLPVVKESKDQGLGDRNRHESGEFPGVVGGLKATADGKQFVLATRGGSIRVTTNTSTIITNLDATKGPELRNGQKVEVTGGYDVNTGQFIATVVEIYRTPGNSDPKVHGLPLNIDTTNWTFDVEVAQAIRFLPIATTVKVVTTDTTIYRSADGLLMDKDAFFAALPTIPKVFVEGAYDSSTGTFTARKARLVEDDPDAACVEVQGLVSEAVEASGTFVVTLGDWDGFSASIGDQVKVLTGQDTKFRGFQNEDLTQSAFFTALATVGAKAKVEGTFEGTDLKAKVCKLLN